MTPSTHRLDYLLKARRAYHTNLCMECRMVYSNDLHHIGRRAVIPVCRECHKKLHGGKK